MKWLLWKDYRHNRPVVIAVLFLLTVPHLIGLCAAYFLEGHHPSGIATWQANLVIASFFSLLACQLVVAVLGGNAFAGERIDRSAEFLASLPITRRRIVTSKIIFTLAIVATIWLVNLPALISLELSRARDLYEIAQIFVVTAITGATFFSVSWALSSCLSSPTFATAGGLLTPLIIGYVSTNVCHMLGVNPDADIVPFGVYCAVCSAVAAVSFFIGTWRYLRRVEP